MKALLIIIFILSSIPSFALRSLPENLTKDWKEKTVFFGVNKAWDYLKQEHTTLTYLARDEAFEYEKFNEEKYWQGLIEARKLGLKFAGISNWKINKKSIEKLGPQQLLIKVEGTYSVKRGLVHFIEWQLFSGEEYHQVALLQDKDSYHPVPKAHIPQLMGNILKLNEKKKGLK